MAEKKWSGVMDDGLPWYIDRQTGQDTRTHAMRAAGLSKPDGNSRQTLRRPVTAVTVASSVRNSGSSRMPQALREYRERRYAQRWRLVWISFWVGYGLVTVGAIAICA